MARFISGEVVVLPFPFTDFSSTKVRPALVLASLARGDVMLCQITSQAGTHAAGVPIAPSDFELGGGLPLASFALPHRIVTAHESCVLRRAGRLKAVKLEAIRESVCAVVRGHGGTP